MRRSLLDRHATGVAVVERLAAKKVPEALGPRVEAFTAAHRAFEEAAQATVEASRAHEAALAAIRAADAALGRAVERLAATLVGAGLGARRNPFKGFSRHSPAALRALPCVTEIVAVRKLAAQLNLEERPAEVVRSLGECLQRAAELQRAVVALTYPQTLWALSRAARDAAAADWNRAYARLRRGAQLALEDDPAGLKALFAAPGRILRPVGRRAKRAQSPAAAPEQAAAGGDGR